jgi:hypothetical protein
VLKFLLSYLLVTGILAGVAMAVPSLVVIGFILLIVPGLVLSLSPTAFLWGLIFTVAWLAARLVVGENLVTVLFAGAVTAALVVGATQAGRTAGQAALDAATLPDVTPGGRIELKGDIRLDRPSPERDKDTPGGQPGRFACDATCVAMLFTPGVTSVTINDSSMVSAADRHSPRGGLSGQAATYRLVPKARCPDGGVQPRGISVNSTSMRGAEERRAVMVEWNLKLANEVCLVRSEPLGNHDMLIRGSTGAFAAVEDRWSFEPSAPAIQHFEIWSGDRLLLRRFSAEVSALSRVLWIAMTGQPTNLRFGWGRSRLGNKARYTHFDHARLLDEHTNIRTKADPAEQLPAMRQQLRAALSDPGVAADSAAFRLIGGFFQALPSPAADEDVAIVADLVRDDRIERYEGIWELKKLPLDQQNRVRAALAERAMSPGKLDGNFTGAALAFIKNMPDGAFARLTPTEEKLLALPEKRPLAAPIIARLDEAGPARVPQLLSFIREHGTALQRNRAVRSSGYELAKENEGHGSVIEASRIALCRLGPKGSAALAPLEEMIASGVIGPRELMGHGGSDWNLTLVRLGMPIGDIRKPASMSGTDGTHRRSIRDKLDRFDPKRHC